MTILTPHEAAGWWENVGGPANRVVAWVSVALAESSLNTEAISPASARGLYQIEPYSWPAGAGPFGFWNQPGANSLAALLLSGHGVNFAPWDTAYRDIYASGRYTFLGWPERGSAAWNNMPYVAARVGAGGQIGAGGQGDPAGPNVPGFTGTLPSALDWYAKVTHQAIPSQIAYTRRLQKAIHGLYRH